MNLFLQRMWDLYNQVGDGIDGIRAIQNALNIENRFLLNDEKYSLEEIAVALGIEEEYNAYQLTLEVGE